MKIFPLPNSPASGCRKSRRLFRWLEACNCTDFWLGSNTFTEFNVPEVEVREVSDIWKRKKFGEVLEAFGPDGPGSCTPCVFPLPLEGYQCKVGNQPSQNPAKSLETIKKNEGK